MPKKKGGIPPWAVALLRGAAEAAILAVIGVLITAIGDIQSKELVPYTPFAVLALRQAEGILDNLIDPTKQRVTGGRAASS